MVWYSLYNIAETLIEKKNFAIAFSFFVDKEMQSFYKRFVRDYLRYKDEIQCAGHEIVKLVREDARAHNLKLKNPGRNGSAPDDTYYALHVRRGDFQYKVCSIDSHCIYCSSIFLFSYFNDRM